MKIIKKYTLHFFLAPFIVISFFSTPSLHAMYKKMYLQNKNTIDIQKNVDTIIQYLLYNDIDDIPNYLNNLSHDNKLKVMHTLENTQSFPKLMITNTCDEIESFIKCGLDINFLSKDKQTLALLAGESGCAESLKRLIKVNADITYTNQKGRTPLEAYLEKKLQNQQNTDLELFEIYIKIRIDHRHTHYQKKQALHKQNTYHTPLYIRTDYNYKKEGPRIIFVYDKDFEKTPSNLGYIEYIESHHIIFFFVSLKNHDNFLEFLHTCEHEITHILQKFNALALQKEKLNISKTEYAKKYLNSLTELGLTNKDAESYNILIDTPFLSWIKKDLDEEEIKKINYEKETEAEKEGVRWIRFPKEYYSYLNKITSHYTYNDTYTKSDDGYMIPHEKQKLLVRYFKKHFNKN